MTQSLFFWYPLESHSLTMTGVGTADSFAGTMLECYARVYPNYPFSNQRNRLCVVSSRTGGSAPWARSLSGTPWTFSRWRSKLCRGSQNFIRLPWPQRCRRSRRRSAVRRSFPTIFFLVSRADGRELNHQS